MRCFCGKAAVSGRSGSASEEISRYLQLFLIFHLVFFEIVLYNNSRLQKKTPRHSAWVYGGIYIT